MSRRFGPTRPGVGHRSLGISSAPNDHRATPAARVSALRRRRRADSGGGEGVLLAAQFNARVVYPETDGVEERNRRPSFESGKVVCARHDVHTRSAAALLSHRIASRAEPTYIEDDLFARSSAPPRAGPRRRRRRRRDHTTDSNMRGDGLFHRTCPHVGCSPPPPTRDSHCSLRGERHKCRPNGTNRSRGQTHAGQAELRRGRDPFIGGRTSAQPRAKAETGGAERSLRPPRVMRRTIISTWAVLDAASPFSRVLPRAVRELEMSAGGGGPEGTSCFDPRCAKYGLATSSRRRSTRCVLDFVRLPFGRSVDLQSFRQTTHRDRGKLELPRLGPRSHLCGIPGVLAELGPREATG